jgi:hypothetical protein
MQLFRRISTPVETRLTFSFRKKMPYWKDGTVRFDPEFRHSWRSILMHRIGFGFAVSVQRFGGRNCVARKCGVTADIALSILKKNGI